MQAALSNRLSARSLLSPKGASKLITGRDARLEFLKMRERIERGG